jgi:SAM-dependent methyltransferase
MPAPNPTLASNPWSRTLEVTEGDSMFRKSAVYYDAIYRAMGKDYAAEAARVHDLIQGRKQSAGHRLLDVACGTGGHVQYLKERYDVDGLDSSPEMLGIARSRNPDLRFHLADMTNFQLHEAFDAVVCLFSGIGYVKTVEKLRQTAQTLAHHTAPGGVVIIDGWVPLDQWSPGHLTALYVNEPELKIARISRSEQEGTLSIMDMHHLIATPEGVDYFVERHEMGLFTPDEYQAALEQAGLRATYEPGGGLSGRGVYIGLQPAGA